MIEIRHGDCIDVMRAMDDACVDAIVTDPPYELGFMGKAWDASGIANSVELWTEALRVLKPGGHLLAFSGSRTYHRMVCAIEDAGFEIRDQIMWLYSQGFPKSRNLRNDFCSCDNCGVDHTHGATEHERLEQSQPQAEYNMRPVRGRDVSESMYSCGERGEVLQQGVPEQGASVGQMQCASDARGCEPGVEGWRYPVQEEGQLYGRDLRESAGMGEADGPQGRVRHAASSGDGSDVRQVAGSVGGGQPHRSQSGQQRAGEPGALPLQRQSQEGRMGENCGGCGKPRVAPHLLGFGTALKPAHEPVVVARKPLIGTVAQNVLQHGTGALNIDACRVGSAEQWGASGKLTGGDSLACYGDGLNNSGRSESNAAGRWPANVIHDGSDEVLDAFAAFGERKSGGANGVRVASPNNCMENPNTAKVVTNGRGPDAGSAARFFYSAKASKADRAGSKHPTVKPLSLCRYLVKLITPPGGTVLDMFAGSGTTLQAAMEEGFSAVGIERELEYVTDIRTRIDAAREGLGLFAVAAE